MHIYVKIVLTKIFKILTFTKHLKFIFAPNS